MGDTEHAAFSEPVPPADDLNLLIAMLTTQFGGKAGNKALRDRLGWAGTPERYWVAHGRALDTGVVVKGQGKGGSVRLSTPEPEVAGVDAPTLDLSTEEYARESSLYPNAMKVIEQGWVREANESTAKCGAVAFRV